MMRTLCRLSGVFLLCGLACVPARADLASLEEVMREEARSARAVPPSPSAASPSTSSRSTAASSTTAPADADADIPDVWGGGASSAPRDIPPPPTRAPAPEASAPYDSAPYAPALSDASPALPETWESPESPAPRADHSDAFPDSATTTAPGGAGANGSIPAAWGGEEARPPRQEDDVDYVNVGAHAMPVAKGEHSTEDRGDPVRVFAWSDASAVPVAEITFDGIWGTIPFAQRASYPSTTERGPGFSIRLPRDWTMTEARNEMLGGNNYVCRPATPQVSVVVTVFPLPEVQDLKGIVSTHTRTLFSSYKVRAAMEAILGKQMGVAVFLEGIRDGEDVGAHFFLCRNKGKGYLIQAYYNDANSAREAASVINSTRIF